MESLRASSLWRGNPGFLWKLDMVMLMIYYQVMIRINIHEAKTHLSRYVERLLGGEVIQLCRRNVPVAELRALTPRRTDPRPLGLAQGVFTVPDAFFQRLPEDVTDAFNNPA